MLPLLNNYQVTVLGDREFCSIALGQWLDSLGLQVCLRLRNNEYIRRTNEIAQQLRQVRLRPGMSLFFALCERH